jgi:uncharacterized membrane protein SpoIIM required for sporulation
VVTGAVFGGFALALDPEAKAVILPFSHLQGDPAERVAKEESGGENDRLDGARSTFAGSLMTHNIRVTLLAMALGMTWGAGTLVLMFHNGVNADGRQRTIRMRTPEGAVFSHRLASPVLRMLALLADW